MIDWAPDKIHPHEIANIKHHHEVAHISNFMVIYFFTKPPDDRASIGNNKALGSKLARAHY